MSVSSGHRELTITHFGFNLDTNIGRAEMKGTAAESHKEWRANARASLIHAMNVSAIRDHHPDLLFFQECRRFEAFDGVVDSLSGVQATLREKGYQVLVNPYDETGGEKAFQYVTAYDPNVFALEERSMRYFSRTPDKATVRPDMSSMSAQDATGALNEIKYNNFGIEWGRCAFIVKLRHKELRDPVYAINVHLDIAEDHRVKATELLIQFVAEIVKQEPGAHILIEGDFNTLPDRGGPEQLAVLRDAKHGDEPLLHEATENLMLSDGTKASHTFIAYPYDFMGPQGRDMRGTPVGDLVLKGAGIDDLISMLEFREDRKCATGALERSREAGFNMQRFLALLAPACRKVMTGLVFEQCSALGGKLDHVYYRGFERVESCDLLINPLYPEPEIKSFNDESAVKNYILANHDKGPAFLSDHQPILTKLVCNSDVVPSLF